MYFELLPNPIDDPRFNDSHGVNLHLCSYDQDRKGRRIIGCPMISEAEVDQKFQALIDELEYLRKDAKQYVIK